MLSGELVPGDVVFFKEGGGRVVFDGKVLEGALLVN